MTKTEPELPERRLPLRAQLRRAWRRLRGGELTPTRAARSVALGLFIGTQPLPGLHLPLVLGACLPLGLDAALSYLAANISIPPVAPFLWLGALQLGARVLRGHFLALDAAGARALVSQGPGPLLGALALGSVMLGTMLAVVGGALTFGLSSLWQRRRVAKPAVDNAQDEAIDRTARRYEKAAKSRGSYYYVRGKLRGDPSTRAVLSLGPLGSVLDLGCGRGQLSVCLLESGSATELLGADWDDKKLVLARSASDGLSARFEQGDVRTAGTEPADTVLLIDVLHYFDRATQDALLVRAAGLVKPGGRLVLRDADTARGWRSTLTRVQEGIGTAIRFNRGERVLFRDVAKELVPLLEGQGFRCALEPCWAGTPFANVLLVATREPS